MSRHEVFTDEEVLSRAREIFVDRGYAVRTKQIATAVGLTWGAIARRFGSKRTLFTQAMAGPDEPACSHDLASDLPGLLERLRSHLWERWPQRLHVRLADPGSGPDLECEALLDRVATVLADHARRGAIRSDRDANSLARVVVALLTGDVAQRYVAGEQEMMADPALVDSVVCLLSGGRPRG